jgi:hypothetical protein
MAEQDAMPHVEGNSAAVGLSLPDQLAEGLLAVLSMPSPAALRRLQGELQQSGLPLTAETWQLLSDFYDYLVAVLARSTSREYSHLASLLDIGAVGIIALQHVLSARGEKHFWWSFLINAFGEGLMVTAARQYVKAWEGEMTAVHEQTTWRVQQSFWRVSQQLRPQLDAAERRQHLDTLFAPLHSNAVSNTFRAILLIRFYQVLLLAYLHLDLEREQLIVASGQ